MIVRLSESAEPVLTDLDRLDRLHAEVSADGDALRFGALCRPGDDDHVWIHIATAREIGVADDPAFGDRFDAMIAFAASKGWVDDDATHVRAHVERPA